VSIRRRWTQFSERRGDAMSVAKDAAHESPPKVSVLEAEISGLRRLLAELRANGDELRQEMDALRRDRDHWQNLAKSAGAAKAEARAWFCGRASSGA
jgi:septal ring factor EnvC (AmiA/AmiB activator)